MVYQQDGALKLCVLSDLSFILLKTANHTIQVPSLLTFMSLFDHRRIEQSSTLRHEGTFNLIHFRSLLEHQVLFSSETTCFSVAVIEAEDKMWTLRQHLVLIQHQVILGRESATSIFLFNLSLQVKMRDSK